MEACHRKSLRKGGDVCTKQHTSQRSRLTLHSRVQHLACQECLMLQMRVQAVERVKGAPFKPRAAAVHPQPSHAATTRSAAVPEIVHSLSLAPAGQLHPIPCSLEAPKQEETALPSKLHPHTIMRRIKAANSVWGLRSAVRHVGYAFSRECICVALSQLYLLYKQQQAQQQAPSGRSPDVQHSSSSSNTPTPTTSSPPGPLKDSTSSIALNPLPSAPRLPSNPPPPQLSLLELMTDTLDCLMHYLAHKGGFAALDPMYIASAASLLGHLLPSIPLHQPTLSPPQPPLPHHERALSPRPCPAPPYRSTISARLSLARDVALSVQPHLHVLSAKQQGMLLQGLARLGFQPSPAWCLAFYRASAVKLQRVAQMQAALLQGRQKLLVGDRGAYTHLEEANRQLTEGNNKLLGMHEGQQQESTPRSMPQALKHARGRGLVEVPGGGQAEVLGVEGLSGREAWAAQATPHDEDPDTSNSSSSRSSDSGSKQHGRCKQPQSPLVPALSSMLWALAHLKCPPPPAWLHANLALSIPHLPYVQPHTLSVLAWALGSLGYQPPPAFTSALLSASGALLEHEQHQHAAQAMPVQVPQGRQHGSRQRCGAVHPHPSPSSCPAGPASAPQEAVECPPRVDAHWSASQHASAPQEAMHLPRVGAHWTASQRVPLLWGIAQLGVQPPAAWMEAFLEGLLMVQGAGKQGMGGSEVSMLVHALAKLELKAAAQLPQQQQQQQQPMSQHLLHQQPPGEQQPNAAASRHTRTLSSAPGQHPDATHNSILSPPAPSAALSVPLPSTVHQHHQLQPSLQPLTNPKSIASNMPWGTTQSPQTSRLQLKLANGILLQPVFQTSSVRPGRRLNLRPKPRPSLPTVAQLPLKAWDQQQQQQQQVQRRQLADAKTAAPAAQTINIPGDAGSAEEPQSRRAQLWHAGGSPRGRQLQERVLAQAMRQVFVLLPECSSRSLATLLWSLAKLRLRPHPAFLAAIMNQFQQRWRAQDAGEQHSSSSGSSFFQKRGSSIEAGLRLELDAIRAQNSKHVNATDTCMLAYSLACLKVKPSLAWQSRLMEAVRMRLRDATPKQLANLVWGLMVMRAHPPTQWLLQLWRVLAGMQDSLGRVEQYQVAMAWLVLPRTHTQRVILAQHYPRLLEHILYPGAGMTAGKSTTTGSAAPPSMAASVGHPAAATPAATAAHTAARGGGNGALPPRDAQGADRGASKSSLPPTKWRMLARVLKEGLARRSTQHARRLWKAGGHVRAGAGDNKKGWQQTKKPLRLRDRMQRVGLVMLTRRRLGGKDSSSPW